MYLINFQIFSDLGKIYISGEISIVEFLGALVMSGPVKPGLVDNAIVAAMGKNGTRGGVIFANHLPKNHNFLGVYLFFNINYSCYYITSILTL